MWFSGATVDPDIESFRCDKWGKKKNIQLSDLFVMDCRKCSSSVYMHVATGVSITMATHCVTVRSPEVICKMSSLFSLFPSSSLQPFLSLTLLFFSLSLSPSTSFLATLVNNNHHFYKRGLIGGIECLCTMQGEGAYTFLYTFLRLAALLHPFCLILLFLCALFSPFSLRSVTSP